MKRRFTFGEYDLSEFLYVEDIERSPLTVENHFVDTFERDEIFLYNNTTGKEIVVKARYIAPAGNDQYRDVFAATGVKGRDGKRKSIAQMLYTKEPQKLYLGDRDEAGELYDVCVVDKTVDREDFAYTSLYTIHFHSPYDCSFGNPVESVITSNSLITNPGNKEIYPTMEFTTKGEEVKIWNSANDKVFIFRHPKSGYAVRIDNESLTATMAGSNVEMNRYIPIKSRWQHIPPGDTRFYFSGIDNLKVTLVPRYIG